jgi:hypothetical protein
MKVIADSPQHRHSSPTSLRRYVTVTLLYGYVTLGVTLPNVGRPFRSDELEVRFRDNVVKRCSA